jgi:signal transduction histidine kinase
VHGLYAWLRRHPRVVDSGLALLLLVSGINVTQPHLAYLVTGPLAVGMIVPVVFRRAYPTAAFAAVIVDGALQVLIARRPMGADFAVLIMLYTLAAYRPRRTSVRGLVICLLGAATTVVAWHPKHLGADPLYRVGTEATVLIAPMLLAWLLGDSLRWRRGYYQALEERARRLERERDALAQVAAAAERARIAREMHDVVAHHVSVMVVQADGAAFALDHAPDQARNALGAISKTGRQALAEMRRLLGVLRTADAGPAELGPMPGLGQLDELAEQTRAGGIPVCVTIDGAPRPLAGGADLAAYRVIQESLTNVRKHGGPDVSAFVTVRYEADQLTIRVVDDGRGAAAASDGAGHGLAGMRERVELYGGTVAAGPRSGGGYQVMAVLPYVPAAAALGSAA